MTDQAPNCEVIEESLLGNLMCYSHELAHVAPILTADDFYIVRHAWIYSAMLIVAERGDEIDNLTVIHELRASKKLDEVGGGGYITFLVNQAGLNNHSETFARLIRAAAIRRRLLAAASEIANAAWKDNATVRDIANYAEDTLLLVTKQVTSENGEGELSASQAMSIAAPNLVEYAIDQREVRGFSTGMAPLDKVLHGIVRGDLIALIGRSGAGKTTIMCQMIVAAAYQGLHTVIFPTEQTVEQYITNLTSHLLGVSLEALYIGHVSVEMLERARREIESWPITFYDRTGPTPGQVTSFVREKIRQNQCQLVIVDGLNDMYVPGAEIYQKTVECATALHSIMRDGTPVLFSVQANRGPSARRNKRPLMSDAQGGEIIAQKVTRFLSLYRPGYDIEIGEVEEKDTEPHIDPRYVEIQILKDRFFNKQGTIVKGLWVAGRGLQDASARQR